MRNDDKPLMTVVTPTYRSPDLYQTIDSVLEQRWPNIEFILVDDATPEFNAQHIREYIETHKGPNLERSLLLQNPENLGTVRTINIGLQAAHGQYIVMLAGDDAFSDPDVLSAWANAFAENDALVITSRRDLYDPELRCRTGSAPNEWQIRQLKILTPQELFERISVENFIFGCSTAYNRRCFERFGYFDPQYRLIDDHPYYLRLLKQGVNIGFLDRVTVKYRGGGVSSTLQFNADYEADCERIFRQEVLPYTKNARRMTRRYRYWQRLQSSERKFRSAMLQAKDSRSKQLLLRLLFHTRYPLRTLSNLLKRFYAAVKNTERKAA